LGLIEVDAGHGAAMVRVFSSGLAAVTAVFGALLRPGDAVAIDGEAYFGARQVLGELFAPMGVEVRRLSAAQMRAGEGFAGVKLVWLETPTNPGLEVFDIRRAAAQAHAAGALLAVDNTTLTPMGQRPLELGADLSVCSDSKMMSGHSDLLVGHIAVRDAELVTQIEKYRTLAGSIPGPMEAWLLLRSLPTLPLRSARSAASALAVARFLAMRPEVTGVLYPGLREDAAAAQISCCGSVLCFTLPSQAAAERFLTRAKLITEATSFGGVTTTAERRARWGHDAIAPGFLRMSVGLEDVEDLIEDMAEALQ
jgi:cystathionine gamma-lyase